MNIPASKLMHCIPEECNVCSHVVGKIGECFYSTYIPLGQSSSPLVVLMGGVCHYHRIVETHAQTLAKCRAQVRKISLAEIASNSMGAHNFMQSVLRTQPLYPFKPQ